MGNGTSSITDSQRASIAHKLKERYEAEIALGKSESELQEVLSQCYNEQLKGYLEVENALKSGSRLSQGTKKPKRKTVPRRRSFDNEKVKDLPPRPPVKTVATDAVLPEQQGSVCSILPEVINDVDPDQKNPPEGKFHCGISQSIAIISRTVDSWDSVRAQPVCLLCKMIFPTETKLETHLKYSVSCLFSSPLHSTSLA